MNACGNMHTSKLDKYKVLDTVLLTGLTKSKDKEYMVVKVISIFPTAEHFFRLFRRLKAWFRWFDLSRVNVYRNDLKENRNYFELA